MISSLGVPLFCFKNQMKKKNAISIQLDPDRFDRAKNRESLGALGNPIVVRVARNRQNRFHQIFLHFVSFKRAKVASTLPRNSLPAAM
jgi:hypothetical protein